MSVSRDLLGWLMASTEVFRDPPKPITPAALDAFGAVVAGTAISVRWRTLKSISNGNRWSGPKPAAVKFIKQSQKAPYWVMGFDCPHLDEPIVVLTPTSRQEPGSFFTGRSRSLADDRIHRVRIGATIDDQLRRQSMPMIERFLYDAAVAHEIRDLVSTGWFTLSEIAEILDEGRKFIAGEIRLLLNDGALVARTRVVSGRGRPAQEFTLNPT